MLCSPWRFDPVRGEYSVPQDQPRAGTGELSVIDAFRGKTVFILGVTGFVGKVLLATVLEKLPEVRHLVIHARKKRAVSGEQRFFADVLTSPPLRAIVERLGLDTIRRKVTVVEGDVNEPHCGVPAELLTTQRGTVDVVVNVAGFVDFDPPLPESLVPNVYGVRHVLELVAALGAKLVHVSTCYVAGQRDGRIAEDVPIVGYFPRRAGPDDRRFDVDEEMA